jgi:multidrug efflux pump subunit AcrB
MGAPAPGYSSAQALSAIEEVAKGMPREFGYEWSGLTLQQKKSEGEASHLRDGHFVRVSAARSAI